MKLPLLSIAVAALLCAGCYAPEERIAPPAASALLKGDTRTEYGARVRANNAALAEQESSFIDNRPNR